MDFPIFKTGMTTSASSAECCRLAGVNQIIALEHVAMCLLYFIIIMQSAVVGYAKEVPRGLKQSVRNRLFNKGGEGGCCLKGGKLKERLVLITLPTSTQWPPAAEDS